MSSWGVQLALSIGARANVVRWPLALMAGLTCLAFVNRANATCGDYLQMVGEHSQADHHAGSDGKSQPAHVPCGCRGAQCNGIPWAPLAPKAPLRSTSPPDIFLFSVSDQTPALDDTGLRIAQAARPNRGYPLLLNRPPDARA